MDHFKIFSYWISYCFVFTSMHLLHFMGELAFFFLAPHFLTKNFFYYNIRFWSAVSRSIFPLIWIKFIFIWLIYLLELYFTFNFHSPIHITSVTFSIWPAFSAAKQPNIYFFKRNRFVPILCFLGAGDIGKLCSFTSVWSILNTTGYILVYFW